MFCFSMMSYPYSTAPDQLDFQKTGAASHDMLNSSNSEKTYEIVFTFFSVKNTKNCKLSFIDIT